MNISEVGDQLDLQVELIARAECCARCGRGPVVVKERPLVALRDLPIGGRTTVLRWRKRRFRCVSCERTFTETDPELPPRRRVTARFRRRLRARVRGGGAHSEIARDEQTTRHQVTRAFGSAVRDHDAKKRRCRGGCRSTRRTIVAPASSRRSCPTSIRAASSTSSTAAPGGRSSATCAR